MKWQKCFLPFLFVASLHNVRLHYIIKGGKDENGRTALCHFGLVASLNNVRLNYIIKGGKNENGRTALCHFCLLPPFIMLHYITL